MHAPLLEIDADIRRARTPPGRFYTDPEVYEVCRERIFARSWHLSELPREAQKDGATWPFCLLPGCLDEPLLLTQAGGQLHCLSNVCTHRGATMLDARSTATSIRCPYHGRCFGRDGRMREAPCFEGAADFPGLEDHLAAAQLVSWRGFSFCSIDPATDLAPALQALEARVGWLFERGFPERPQASRSYEFAANWALYVENYAEGFHIPYVHPALAGAVDFRSYETLLFEGGSVQIGQSLAPEDAFALPAGHPDGGRQVGGYFFLLHPGTMLNFYPWGLSINLVQALGPARTRVVYQTYVQDAGRAEQGLGRGLDQIELEDQEVVLRCQAGLRSRLYRRGRYAPEHEQGPHAFHRWLAGLLSRAPADSGESR